jgi:hypothetical protein
MTNHDNLQAVGLFALIALGCFFGFLASPQVFPPPLNIQLAVVSTAIDLIAAIIYFAYKYITGVAPLDLKPLPHYQGYSLPPSMEEAKRFQEKYKQFPRGGVLHGPSDNLSHPDAKLLQPSQVMAKYVFDPDTLVVENALIAKFGVIRVSSLFGTVKNCKVAARYRTLEEAGKVVNDRWNEGGFLNWYSPELSDRIRGENGVIDEIDKQGRARGINKYLLKSEETITKNDPKDLLVFYMIEHIPNVYLCSSMENAPLGWAEKGPVKFELELTVTGESEKGYSRTFWKYQGTAVWDHFKLDKV